MLQEDRLEDLRTRVAYSELELRTALDEFERVARNRLDPREWVRTRPLTWLGAAFLIGLFGGGCRR